MNPESVGGKGGEGRGEGEGGGGREGREREREGEGIGNGREGRWRGGDGRRGGGINFRICYNTRKATALQQPSGSGGTAGAYHQTLSL